MGRLTEAVRGIHSVDGRTAAGDAAGKIHPLARLLTALFYIIVVVSFHKYDIAGLAGMAVYPLSLAIVEEIPFGQSLKRIWPVFFVTCMVGIANPFLDRSAAGYMGALVIRGGVVSMLSLVIKGIFTVLASYFLVMTVGIEQICYALRALHVPKGFVTVLLLTYRYLIVLLKEVERMSQAYLLRAPGQKGIHMRAWGPFAGNLLLRSIDRAEVIYDSMMLRGYDGEFRGNRRNAGWLKSVLYVFWWSAVFTLFRLVPVFKVVGSLFV